MKYLQIVYRLLFLSQYVENGWQSEGLRFCVLN
jgi:hypothetical protein